MAPAESRFHKIVRKQPPSEWQKFAITVSASASLIFAAMRYIPVCRESVSRKDVVASLRFGNVVLAACTAPGGLPVGPTCLAINLLERSAVFLIIVPVLVQGVGCP